MDLFNYLNKNRTSIFSMGVNKYHRNKGVECNDGFVVSIQCNSCAYCLPREDFDDVRNYKSFELGFPNRKDDLIMEYAEDDQSPTETVYGYVPSEIVIKLIEKHGGIKE